MAIYCRVENGAIVERRSMAPESIPAHKTSAWRPLIDDGRPDATALQYVESAEVIEPTHVRVQYTVKSRPANAVKSMIKEEARRRILVDFPEWKQANMTARGVELLQIRMARTWTAEEQAEVDGLSAAWSRIKAIRSASDALEASMPADFATHASWPE